MIGRRQGPLGKFGKKRMGNGDTGVVNNRENTGELQHIFVVGAKGLGSYGGYETFIKKLTEYHASDARFRYHVAVKANGEGHMDETKLAGVTRLSDTTFLYQNAECFKIQIPEKLGHAQAILYDVRALAACCRMIEERHLPHPIVYVLTCRIGPFFKKYADRIRRLGGKVYLNPDGHEWMRAKWSRPVRQYWKYSERRMVRYSDKIVCDSVNIETYIHRCYDGDGAGGKNPDTCFIAYGAETRKSPLADDAPQLAAWYRAHGLSKGSYYLVVGRFVPENNYETMIREFMKSGTKRSFAIITNVNDKFLEELEQKLHFRKDPRIRFVGTVYDADLLQKIRENAYGYFHGHEVGGTNPSLLEALGSTELNLLLDVGFNREVAEDNALYWTKRPGDLAALIDRADAMTEAERRTMGEKAKARILRAYSWPYIADRYARVFLGQPLDDIQA